jgi:LysM repeat protein/ABC-type branched-subunit amino acid transport system substrate-binding protein
MVFAQPGKDKQVTLHSKKYYQHIVSKGETVYGVAKDFNMGVKDIVLENPKAINGIAPGDTLNIPFAIPGPVNNTPTIVSGDSGLSPALPFIYHKVEAKETLYSLSKKYNVSINTMDSLNPEVKDKGLRIGMVIRVTNNVNYDASKGHFSKDQVTHKDNTLPADKRDTNKEKQAYKNLVQKDQGTTTSQTTPITTTQGKMLNRYNVALMMAFMPQEVDSVKMNRLVEGTQQFPLMASISADFYNGVRMALDSLAMQSVDINLHVYNIPTDSAAHKIDSILKSPAMANMNLIIGPPYPSNFRLVAKYAKEHQIPIVSPLSTENSILKDNAFTSKGIPSPSTEMEQTADYIAAHYPKANIIIMRNRDAINDNYYDLFKKRLNTALSIALSKADSATVANYSDDLSDITKKLSPDKNNVIAVPYQGSSFVIKMLNQIGNAKFVNNDSIVLFGMHSWTTMDVMDLSYLDTLHFHVASNEYVDYTNHAVNRFIMKYRNNYYTEPSSFAYQGFDVAYFYLSMLKKYGTALQDHLGDDKYKGVHTTFDFYRPDPTGGYENKAVYILEYKTFNLVKDN